MDKEKEKVNSKDPELKVITVKADDPELRDIIKNAKNTRIIIEDCWLCDPETEEPT